MKKGQVVNTKRGSRKNIQRMSSEWKIVAFTKK